MILYRISFCNSKNALLLWQKLLKVFIFTKFERRVIWYETF